MAKGSKGAADLITVKDALPDRAHLGGPQKPENGTVYALPVSTRTDVLLGLTTAPLTEYLKPFLLVHAALSGVYLLPTTSLCPGTYLTTRELPCL